MPLTENSEPAPLSPGTRIAGSFRDPSGFVFEREGVLYRQVNSSYRENYGRLMQSGLYDKLAGEGLLVAAPGSRASSCGCARGIQSLAAEPGAVYLLSLRMVF